MQNLLIIDSAATGEASVSRGLTNRLAASIAGREGVAIVRRDVGAEPIPHLVPATVATVRGAEPDSDAARVALALSDTLVAELRAADVIVIGAPMYNFGMPSTLKAWFDHVLRARVTFQYGADGPEGLLTGKRAIVVSSRGGAYSDGPAAAMDNQEPHIRTLLGFMGITDVTFVRAEGLASDAEAAIAAAADRLGPALGADFAMAA